MAYLESAGSAVAAGSRAECKVGKVAPSHSWVAEELLVHLHQVVWHEMAVEAAEMRETEAATRRPAASGVAAP